MTTPLATPKNPAAVELGRLGGLATSDRKTRAVRENAKKGGRPRIKYQALQYAADGCADDPGSNAMLAEGTLAECRAAIRYALGSLRGRRCDGDTSDVEAYHDFPASHPQADGCGGYSIQIQ